MGTLTDLLKNISHEKVTETKVIKEQITPNIMRVSTSKEVKPKELIGTLTPENYEIVKNSVATIDTTNKDRREIIIGMYGLIKNPSTGKRFVIPTLTWDDEDYTYQYAKYMKTLVNRPDDFTKIMNWE